MIEFPEFLIGESPQESLRMFLITVQQFLMRIIDRDTIEIERLIKKLYVYDLSRAAAEVSAQFDDAYEQIITIPDKVLTYHGLSGFQLRIKLEIVRERHRRYEKRQGRTALRRLLDVIDDVLDSIGDVLPPVKAIAEFKDVVKNCIRV